MLRCKHCGTEISEWAARCPTCRNKSETRADPTGEVTATDAGGGPGAPARDPSAGTHDRPLSELVIPALAAALTPAAPLTPAASGSTNGHARPLAASPATGADPPERTGADEAWQQVFGRAAAEGPGPGPAAIFAASPTAERPGEALPIGPAPSDTSPIGPAPGGGAPIEGAAPAGPTPAGPTPGEAGPTPGEATPIEGAAPAGPTPTGPTPGEAAPIEGAAPAGPTPTGPTPGEASPVEGAAPGEASPAAPAPGAATRGPIPTDPTPIAEPAPPTPSPPPVLPELPPRHGRRHPGEGPARPPTGPAADAGPAPRIAPVTRIAPLPPIAPPAPPRRSARGGSRFPRPSPAVVIIGLAVMALVVTLVVSQATRHPGAATQVLGTSTQRPPGSGGTSTSDLFGYTLVAADAATGVAIAPFSETRREIPGFTGAGPVEPPVRSGERVVVLHDGIAYVLAPPYTAAPVAIGPAVHLFPTLTAGTVGIQRPAVIGSPAAVEIAALPHSGLTGAAPVPLPGDVRPVAELPSGILLETPAGLLSVWQPSAAGAGTVVRPLGASAGVVGWSGDRVAWLAATGCTPNGECPLHVTDASTGGDVVVAPPEGFAGYLGRGSFSPADSHVLAAFVFNPVQQAPAARLVLLDFTTAGATRARWVPALVPDADIDLAPKSTPPVAVWTPDGGHVLFSSDSGHIHEYQPAHSASYATEQPATTSFTVVQVPPSPSPSP